MQDLPLQSIPAEYYFSFSPPTNWTLVNNRNIKGLKQIGKNLTILKYWKKENAFIAILAQKLPYKINVPIDRYMSSERDFFCNTKDFECLSAEKIKINGRDFAVLEFAGLNLNPLTFDFSRRFHKYTIAIAYNKNLLLKFIFAADSPKEYNKYFITYRNFLNSVKFASTSEILKKILNKEKINIHKHQRAPFEIPLHYDRIIFTADFRLQIVLKHYLYDFFLDIESNHSITPSQMIELYYKHILFAKIYVQKIEAEEGRIYITGLPLFINLEKLNFGDTLYDGEMALYH